MKTIGLPGVSYGGVSRRDGWSAVGRSRYQMGIETHDGVPETKRRGGEPVEHVRQWLMLPAGVDRAVWSPSAIWAAAGRCEKRRDAREARYFDVTWLRGLPTKHLPDFVEALFTPFVEMGLPVQVDWETSRGDDGKANDHVHGLIGTRPLSNDGFDTRKMPCARCLVPIRSSETGVRAVQ